LLVVQVGALLALGVSAALSVDYFGIEAVYCGPDSGCDLAKALAHRWLYPLPVPLVGLFGFTTLLALSAFTWRRAVRRLLIATASVAGLSGLGLLGIQVWVLKRFCPGCVLVDLLAVVIAIAALLFGRTDDAARPRVSRLTPLVLALYGCFAILIPGLWPHFRPEAPVPTPLLSLQSKTGQTLVEFVDLQCPHCVALYPTLEQLRREYGSSLEVRRFHVPTERHRLARKAALLLRCTSRPEDAERLERALFLTAPLTDKTLNEAATSLGFSQLSMERCWTDPNFERVLSEHRALFRRLGHLGLPTVFVGGERIVGAMPAVVYRAAIEKARRTPASREITSTAFWGIVALLVLGTYFVGQRNDHEG
jgi:predicted DsbA family dithiol-disulfide isomerase/uncharacterized membrane protein